MRVDLLFAPQLATYRFPSGHPMRPERFTLTVDLARQWDLIARDTEHTDGLNRARVVGPPAATDEDLMLVHSAEYVRHVKAASEDPSLADLSYGLGPGDTPAFPGVHRAAALAVGATVRAVESVLLGDTDRAFSPAGGMHHAHRDRASGFCVYNDPAVAIARALSRGLAKRIAYVDIDAHHGDGVEEAFFDRGDVLTVSVHESGRFLFPGTGTREREGRGEGEGLAINVPLLPDSGDAEYLAALDDVVAPAVREFAPDIIVAQLGADAHTTDPLTHLRLSVPGYVESVRRVVALADEVCHGRLAATGGGGYQPYSAVPVMWASALAVLLDREVPQEPPASWLRIAEEAATRAL